MKIIVPLAGPDFERPDGGVKAELLVDGEALLPKVFTKRAWWRRRHAQNGDVVFVLRNTDRSRAFAASRLADWFPGCKTVFLSSETRGAAMTAIAGLALVADSREPVCIDLVDIDYDTEFDAGAAFSDGDVGAVALVFPSTNPVYSYLRTDDRGEVVEAAEKKVISQNASAGTYFFASPADYLAALADNLRHRDEVMHKGLFFVCPVFNGVLSAGKRVVLERVSGVQDIKIETLKKVAV